MHVAIAFKNKMFVFSAKHSSFFFLSFFLASLSFLILCSFRCFSVFLNQLYFPFYLMQCRASILCFFFGFLILFDFVFMNVKLDLNGAPRTSRRAPDPVINWHFETVYSCWFQRTTTSRAFCFSDRRLAGGASLAKISNWFLVDRRVEL